MADAYYLKHRTEILKKNRANYHKNKEEILAKNRRWRESNPEQFKKSQGRYYLQNKEKLKEKSIQRYWADKDKILQKEKQRYWDNPSVRYRLIRKARRYYQTHKEKILNQISTFAKSHREVRTQIWREYKQRHPKKEKARYIAKYRIPIPEQQICEICNSNPASQRHHPNYLKPLDILFVCPTCNGKFERVSI